MEYHGGIVLNLTRDAGELSKGLRNTALLFNKLIQLLLNNP